MKNTHTILPFIVLLISTASHQNLHCAALEPIGQCGVRYGTQWARRAVLQATRRIGPLAPRQPFSSRTLLKPTGTPPPSKLSSSLKPLAKPAAANIAGAIQDLEGDASNEAPDESQETPPEEPLSMEPPIKKPEKPVTPPTSTWREEIRKLLKKPKRDKPMPSIDHPRHDEATRIANIAKFSEAAKRLEEAQKNDEAYEQEHAHYSFFNKIYAWFKQKWNNWNKKAE